MIASIKHYFNEHMDDQIGDLKASLLLDFILQEIGPVVYNQAVLDAHAFMSEKLGDLESSVYKAEFMYWQKG